MALKKLIVNQRNGGISNDKYVGQAGSFYDGESMNVRSNSKAMTPSSDGGTPVEISGQGNAIYNGSLGAYILCDTGYINLSGTYNVGNELYKVKGSSTGLSNLIVYNAGGTSYGLLVTYDKIHKFPFYSTQKSGALSGSLGMLDTTLAPSWAGTGWTNSSGSWTHTTGTNALTGTVTVGGTGYWRVQVTMTGRTAGSVTINIGGSSVSTTYSTNTTFSVRRTAASANDITITPTSDFDGTINTNVLYANLSLVTEDYISFATTSFFKPYIKTVANEIIFGNGNGLALMDSVNFLAGGALANNFTLNYNDTIRAITLLGDQYVIWVQDGSNGYQYFWNGLTDRPDRSVVWYDLPIQNVANLGATNIVRATGTSDGGYQTIWRTDGYNRTLLYKSNINSQSYIQDAYNRILLVSSATNAIESFGEIVLLPGKNAIYAYGKKFPGFPDALTKEYTVNGTLTAMSTTYSSFGVCYITDSSTYYYVSKFIGDIGDYLNIGSTNKFSRLRMLPVIGTSKTTNKAAKKIGIGYKIEDATRIAIFGRIDREKDRYSFIIDTTENPITTLPVAGDTYTDTTSYGVQTYTVLSVTSFNDFVIIETQKTAVAKTDYLTGGALVKATGSGSNITYNKVAYMRLIDVISDYSKYKYSRMYNKNFYEIEFGLWVLKQDQKTYAEISEFTFIYDEIEDDLK